MNFPKLSRSTALILLALLPGCLATQSGSLEVLNPKQAYGQSVAVVGDLHRENEAIETRLASDLRTALSKSGLTVADDPAKADLVVVPTLGRMRERGASPAQSVGNASAESAVSAEASEPVIAAPTPEARPFNRFSSANVITRGDLISRRAVPSAKAPVGAQQAGLLLTAYRAADYQDYGVGRQSLPPVWRIYVSQPATHMKWNSVAVPLINAAARAAMPLAKEAEGESVEGGARKKDDEGNTVRAGEPRHAGSVGERTKSKKDAGEKERDPETKDSGRQSTETAERVTASAHN